MIDAAVAITLASTALFNVDVSAARTSIIFSLMGTMVPFILLAPSATLFVEKVKVPRLLIAMSINGLRILGLVLMGIASAHSETTRYAIFPLAFIMLTLSKCYSVAKTSALPQVTTRESFAYFSSRLAMSTSIVAMVAGAMFLTVNRVFSESLTLYMAAIMATILIAISVGNYLRLMGKQKEFIAVSDDNSRLTTEFNDNVEDKKIFLDPKELIYTINKLFLFGAGFRFVVGAITIEMGLKYRNDKALLGALFIIATVAGFATNAVAAWINKQSIASHIQFVFLGVVSAFLLGMLVTDVLLWSLLVVLLVGVLAALARVFYESRLAMILPASYNARILSRGEVYLQLAWVLGAFAAVATYSYQFVGLVSSAVLVAAMVCIWKVKNVFSV